MDLPEPGAKPVDLCEISPRCRIYLQSFRELMLKEGWQQEVESCTTKPYMDPRFRVPSHLLMLAVRMSKAGMLRRVRRRCAGVTMFTVVKKWEEKQRPNFQEEGHVENTRGEDKEDEERRQTQEPTRNEPREERQGQTGHNVAYMWLCNWYLSIVILPYGLMSCC